MATKSNSSSVINEKAEDEITRFERIESQTLQPREKAVEFLLNAKEEATFTYEEEKAVLRRIDFRILPLILGAYFFQQLDKSTLSYVSIFGITEDAHLHGREYSWLGSTLYIAQLIMQPVAAFLLVKYPTGKLIAGAVFFWGASLAIMASCTNFRSLVALRALLGTFESMIQPSCVAVTQMWWRRSEQTLRTSYWTGMNGLTVVVGSLFTYGLGSINSPVLYHYQVIFLFCGLLTMVFSVFVLIYMPDSPMAAKYLKDREKVIAVKRLQANQMGIASGQWRWDHVVEALVDLKTWCWFVILAAISICSGGLSAFGNLIVKSFGFTNFETILFNAPAGILQIIWTIGSAWAATRTQKKGLTIAILSVCPIIGTAMLLTVPRDQKGILLFGNYLLTPNAAITPLIFAWSAQNTAGDTKRKSTSALVFIGMCTGNIIGPLLYSTEDAPLYRSGLISTLILFILVGLLGLTIPIYLKFLNMRHSKQREALGKSAEVIDESMIGKNKIETSDNGSKSKSNGIDPGDKGFSDVTDLNNEDFIYVY